MYNVSVMKEQNISARRQLSKSRLLATGVATLALLGGGKATYEAGQYSQQDKIQEGISQAYSKGHEKGNTQGVLAALHPKKEIQEDLETLKTLSVEEVEALKGDKLWEKATDVQSAVLDLSEAFNVNNRELVDTLVPEEVIDTFDEGNVHFKFTDEACLNSIAKFADNGQLQEAIVPFSAD
jgi:hypothetical protein